MKKIIMFFIMILGVFLNKTTASLEKGKEGIVQKNSEHTYRQASLCEEEQKLLESRLRGLGYFH
ncbi:MAG: hypothetical protein D6813_07760 [Calditrichaeota bacterium]|nr:MAG: hypothetical protein D6813_07760 [Calditrichota bacterium]